MSVSPRQNFLNPPPVPEIPTVTLIDCFFAFWKSSATASVIGNTVLEPSIFTTLDWARASPADANTPASANANAIFLLKIIWLLLVWTCPS